MSKSSATLHQSSCGDGRLHRRQLVQLENVASFGPGVIQGGHLADSIAILPRQVFRFGAIGFHVVKFPAPAVSAHQLPFAQSHRSIAFMLPKNWIWIRMRALLPLKNRQKARALQRDGLLSLKRIRLARPGQFEAGGHYVRDVPRLSIEASSCFNDFRPRSDKRARDSPFMREMLVEQEGRVADISPGNSVALPNV